MDKNPDQLSEYEKIAQKCPITAAMSALGGRWKLLIVYQLQAKTMRFSELERSLPGITQAMLTQQLRALEKDGIIHRQVYPVIPPKVEYSLTALGHELHSTFGALAIWGCKLIASRANHR